MKRPRPKRESVLLKKSNAEHERLFQAFADRRGVAWPGTGASGTARVARAEVFSVQHAGTKTLFVLHVLEPPDGREEG